MSKRSERIPSKNINEMELEERHGVNGRPSPLGSVAVLNQFPHETQVEFRFNLTVEIILGDEIIQTKSAVELEDFRLVTEHCASLLVASKRSLFWQLFFTEKDCYYGKGSCP